jgi:putative ABC transport system ATP-binding protein
LRAVEGLTLAEVTKVYRDASDAVRAVDSVSLTIAPGECVALYGPSGSGKSTLLQLAGGIQPPDSGSVTFEGRDITRLSVKDGARFRRDDVGFVFQTPLMGAATALENAAIKLLACGLSPKRANEIARPWIDRVGLSARCDQPARSLSMGERQRVWIARALAGKPKLLLADEPTAHLDSARTHSLLELMRDISHERDVACLIVTHDSAAQGLVDNVYSLRDGRLADGLDAELRAAADFA